jgi:putative membrane protein
MGMLEDLLSTWYPWTKTLHVVSVIAWMAGLFYLPRLFVYHAERVALDLPQAAELFETMERRLYRAIMNPSMMATWLFGLALVLTPGIVDWTSVWPWAKGASVVAMTWFHLWLGRRRLDFAAGVNRLDGRRYRMMNEVPTLLMLVIVAAVIVKF